MKQSITISREFGSGGREIGFKLAERLGIPFYDKEIISMAAQDSHIAESILKVHDEKAPKMFEYAPSNPFSIYRMPMSDQIFLAQSKVIKELVDQGPCVIVGRCASSILSNSINLYIHADIEHRIHRKQAMNTGVDSAKLKGHIYAIDKQREKYYQHYANKPWGQLKDYHLTMDSGLAGVDGCVECAAAFISHVWDTTVED